ncbi:alginate export family protein [Lacunimicrobium album]
MKVSCADEGCTPSSFGEPCEIDDCETGLDWFNAISSDEPFLSCLKDMQIGETGLTASAGGAYRFRYLDEDNRLRPGGPGRSSYTQHRFTPYLDLAYEDLVKGHLEIIDASTFHNDLPELPIDTNRWDILQAYIDVKIFQNDSGTLRGRYGRQTLLYGDQHIISPLGWANTYRNFEGGKLYWSGENWDIDGFVVRPVNGAARNVVYRPESFDSPDQSHLFSGIYATYKSLGLSKMDLFFLIDNEQEDQANRPDGELYTLGTRIYGKRAIKDGGEAPVRTWAWDTFAAYQCGSSDFLTGLDQNVGALGLNLMVSHTWNQATWSPTVGGLIWYGSGDPDPNDGQINTYNTLYPLGHAYWGILDNFNGSNLVDFAFISKVSPSKKLDLNAVFHYFRKAHSEDYIYNIGGAPFGAAGTPYDHIGNELDLIATYKLNANWTAEFGYSWFWYGDAVQKQPAINRSDASQLYFLTEVKF